MKQCALENTVKTKVKVNNKEKECKLFVQFL